MGTMGPNRMHVGTSCKSPLATMSAKDPICSVSDQAQPQSIAVAQVTHQLDGGNRALSSLKMAYSRFGFSFPCHPHSQPHHPESTECLIYSTKKECIFQPRKSPSNDSGHTASWCPWNFVPLTHASSPRLIWAYKTPGWPIEILAPLQAGKHFLRLRCSLQKPPVSLKAKLSGVAYIEVKLSQMNVITHAQSVAFQHYTRGLRGFRTIERTEFTAVTSSVLSPRELLY